MCPMIKGCGYICLHIILRREKFFTYDYCFKNHYKKKNFV